ncbi:GntR family transcriptional regulator [Bacillus sp. FJAT-27251]|uniref:GntR family transcriptional regulator n=1 Tax=Bacillus sp. FJAT-27251 TaxID=1684142 RepID=UPI0006A7B314|nr:GntR family transcriptional regulator [Bacillus sp. FJAT-27251]
MINKQLHIPLYYQLAQSIQKQIDSGDLKPGESLPTEREYAENLNISRMTVRQALNQLVNNGYLYRVQGKGTFVAECKIEKPLTGITSFTEDMMARGLEPSSKLLHFELIPATPDVANQLQIKENSPVYEIKRIRLADHVPMAIEINYISANLVKGLTEKIVNQSIYAYMEDQLNLRIEQAIQTIESSLAEPNEAQLLQMKDGAPLMRIQRTAFLYDGTPAEYVLSAYRADRYKFTVHIHRQ